MHVAKTGSGSGETSRPAPLPLADDDAARVTGEEEERTVFAGAPSRHIGSLTRQQSLWMRRRPCSGWPLNSQRGPVFEGALSGRQPEGRPARDRRLWAPEIAVFWAGILHALFLAGHCSSHWGCSGPCAWAGTGAAPAGHSNRSMVHAGEGVLFEFDDAHQWRERGRGEMRVNVANKSGQVRGMRLFRLRGMRLFRPRPPGASLVWG